MSDETRRFSDQEFSLILRTAAELQADNRVATTADGLRLSEIKEIAAETGIDPNLIDRAVHQFEAAKGEAPSPSGPLQLTAWVEGEITREDLGRLRDAIKGVLGAKARGSVEEVFDSLEWRADPGSTIATQVSVTPRDGQTRIELYDPLTGPRVATYMLSGLGGLIFGLVAGGTLASLELVSGNVGLFLALLWGPILGALSGRSIWSRIYVNKRNKLAGALERLRQATSNLVKTETRPPALTAPDEVAE